MDFKQDNVGANWPNLKNRTFFLNHHSSKQVPMDDSKTKYRFHETPLHVSTGEYIPLQHGSPDLRRNSVYPSHPSPIPAFQMPGQYSPKFISSHQVQEMRSGAHNMSPLSMRTRLQEASFMTSADPDEAVVKISSMFPTVSDTHIRLLLKKYHNREAVVISALQVEKHPIATPGPFATPPPNRNNITNSHHVVPHLQMTPPLMRTASSRNSSPTLRTTSTTNSTYTGSPRFGEAYRYSPRPHSSPKLKLRYMKSIFPEADETIILDVLANNENNIQKASVDLKEMGFSKKDTIKLRQEIEENKVKAEAKKAKDSAELEELKLKTPTVLPRKTKKEKDHLKEKLQKKYGDVPDHIISIALESVHFDEIRASQILEIMVQEDIQLKKEEDETVLVITEKHEDGVDNYLSAPIIVTTSQSRQSLKSILKEKQEINNKTIFSRVIEENSMNNSEFKSLNLSNTKGSNPDYIKGTNEKLLLEDYIKWQGPDPKNRSEGKKSLAKGANKELLLGKKNCKANGPNAKLRKGPIFGLAKGSIFSQLKSSLFGGESRGK